MRSSPSRNKTRGLVMREMPTLVLFAWPPEIPLARASPMWVFLQPCSANTSRSFSTLCSFDLRGSCNRGQGQLKSLTACILCWLNQCILSNASPKKGEGCTWRVYG